MNSLEKNKVSFGKKKKGGRRYKITVFKYLKEEERKRIVTMKRKRIFFFAEVQKAISLNYRKN